MHGLAMCLILGACLVAGCGGGDGKKATGTAKIMVTYGGQPVSEGAVQLVVAGSGMGAYGQLDASGTVTLADVEVANYTVVVTPPPPPDPVPGSPATVKDYPNIPQIYREQKTSPLKAEVKPTSNEFKFELKP